MGSSPFTVKKCSQGPAYPRSFPYRRDSPAWTSLSALFIFATIWREKEWSGVLKKWRFLLLKRQENLQTEQRFRLRDLLRYNLKIVRAYLFEKAFQQL
jgi:hypothetical protein